MLYPGRFVVVHMKTFVCPVGMLWPLRLNTLPNCLRSRDLCRRVANHHDKDGFP